MGDIDTYWYFYAIFLWTVIAWIGCKYFSQKSSPKLYFALVYIPLSLIAGLRHWSVSDDTLPYLHIFYRVQGRAFEALWEGKGEKEVGYLLLNAITALITEEGQCIILLCAIVTICGYGLFFYKYSSDFYLSTVLYVGLISYFSSFILIRQQMATMILLWAMQALWRGRRKRFVYLVLLASTVHVAALVFLPFVVLYPLSLRRSIICLLVVSLFAVSFIGAGQGLSMFKPFLATLDVFARYAHYIGGRYDVSKPIGFGVLRSLLWGGISIYGLYLYRRFYQKLYALKDENVQFLLWNSLFVFLFALLTPLGYYGGIIGRISVYFSVYIYLLFPFILTNFTNRSREVVKVFSCLACLAFLVIFVTRHAAEDYYAYRFFFDW